VRLVIFGLDEITTPEEVEKAVIAATGEDPAVKAVMRKMPRGLQMAIITVNVDTAHKAAELGRIRVGYTYCRVRMWHESKRCFRCLASNHETRKCQGTDRSGCCFGCGNTGHFIKDCNETDEKRAEFNEKLRSEEAGAHSQ